MITFRDFKLVQAAPKQLMISMVTGPWWFPRRKTYAVIYSKVAWVVLLPNSVVGVPFRLYDWMEINNLLGSTPYCKEGYADCGHTSCPCSPTNFKRYGEQDK